MVCHNTDRGKAMITKARGHGKSSLEAWKLDCNTFMR